MRMIQLIHLFIYLFIQFWFSPFYIQSWKHHEFWYLVIKSRHQSNAFSPQKPRKKRDKGRENEPEQDIQIRMAWIGSMMLLQNVRSSASAQTNERKWKESGKLSNSERERQNICDLRLCVSDSRKNKSKAVSFFTSKLNEHINEAGERVWIWRRKRETKRKNNEKRH